MKAALSLPDPLFEAADRLAGNSENPEAGSTPRRSRRFGAASRRRHRRRLHEIYDAAPELAKLDLVLDPLQPEVLR